MSPWKDDLRRAVEAKGTQEDVAHELDVSLSTLQRWLAGSVPRRRKSVEAIERVLEISVPRSPPRQPRSDVDARLDQLEDAVLLLRAEIDERIGGGRAAQLRTGGDATVEALAVFELLRRRRQGRRGR